MERNKDTLVSKQWGSPLETLTGLVILATGLLSIGMMEDSTKEGFSSNHLIYSNQSKRPVMT